MMLDFIVVCCKDAKETDVLTHILIFFLCLVSVLKVISRHYYSVWV